MNILGLPAGYYFSRLTYSVLYTLVFVFVATGTLVPPSLDVVLSSWEFVSIVVVSNILSPFSRFLLSQLIPIKLTPLGGNIFNLRFLVQYWTLRGFAVVIPLSIAIYLGPLCILCLNFWRLRDLVRTLWYEGKYQFRRWRMDRESRRVIVRKRFEVQAKEPVEVNIIEADLIGTYRPESGER